MQKLRIVLLGSRTTFTSCLLQVLRSQAIIDTVHQVESSDVFKQLVEGVAPDIILLDFNDWVRGEFHNFSRGLKRYQENAPPHKWLTLCLNVPLRSFELRCLNRMGIQFCLEEGASFEELRGALLKLAKNAQFLSGAVARCLAEASLQMGMEPPHKALKLPLRELQVCQALSRGESALQLAQRLSVSPKTVQTYRYRIFRKLNVKSDVQLTLLWQRICSLGIVANVE